MHSAILSRVTAASGAALSRIGSARGPIVCAFFDRRQSPLWVAKRVTGHNAVARLRKERDALAYLDRWARQLGIPQVLEWHEDGNEALLIQTGVPGKRRKIALPVCASDSTVNRTFQRPLEWLERFHHTVVLPRSVPVSEVVNHYCTELARRAAALGSVDGLVRILSDPNAARKLNTVCVHGDFHETNVLYPDSGLAVVDWPEFGPGFPFQDAFGFIVNANYFRPGHVLDLVENYHHVFFSDSGVCRQVRHLLSAIIESGAAAGEDARFLFYGFLVTQVCLDSSTPMERWREILAYLARFDWPAPCTLLPPPRPS